MKGKRGEPISVRKFNHQKWGNFYVDFLKNLSCIFRETDARSLDNGDSVYLHMFEVCSGGESSQSFYGSSV